MPLRTVVSLVLLLVMVCGIIQAAAFGSDGSESGGEGDNDGGPSDGDDGDDGDSGSEDGDCLRLPRWHALL